MASLCKEAIQGSRDDSMLLDSKFMTSPPYNWTCALEWEYKEFSGSGFTKKYYRGTGFKINFSHVNYSVVVTAAHVLWNKVINRYPEKVKLKFPGEDVITVFEKNLFVPSEYRNQKNDYVCDDYGLIFYESNSSNGFGWKTEIKESSLQGDSILVCGFPSSDYTVHLPIEDLKMSIAGGKLKTVQDYELQYSNDTMKGQSGSPIYLCYEGSVFTAIGIHIAGGTTYNVGRRLDLELIARFARAMNCQKCLESVQNSSFHLCCKTNSDIWGNVTSNVTSQRSTRQISDKFFIYPVAMPSSLYKTSILLKFVIESVENKEWFFSIHYKETIGEVLYIKKCPTYKVKKDEMFYLKKERPNDTHIYSIISVAKRCYRICSTSGTVMFNHYERIPHVETNEIEYSPAALSDKFKIIATHI